MRKMFVDATVREEVKSLYLRGYSTYTLSKKYNCDRSVISRLLNEEKIEKRNAFQRARHDLINQNFFEKIDSAEKAYFFGLILADGCLKIGDKQQTLSISLKKEDRYLLEMFRDCVKSSNKIYDHNHKNGKVYCYFSTSNRKIISDLIKLGCEPRKSLTCLFPHNSIPEEFMADFVRGYFDGDGSIIFKKPYNYPVVSICVSKKFGEVLQQYLSHKSIKSVLKPMRSIYGLRICSSQVIRFLHFIYEEAGIWMKRKKDRSDTLIQMDINRKAKKTSEYKGICSIKGSNKWVANITKNGVRKYLGRFKTEDEAFLAYQKENLTSEKRV